MRAPLKSKTARAKQEARRKISQKLTPLERMQYALYLGHRGQYFQKVMRGEERSGG